MNEHMFFEHAPYALWSINKEGRLLKYNRAFLTMISQSELLPVETIKSFISEMHYNKLLSLWQNGGERNIDLQFTGNESISHWYIQIENDLLYAYQSIKQEGDHERQQNISTESLLRLANHSSDMIASFDESLRYRFVNDEIIRQVGHLKPSDFIGRTTEEMAPLLRVGPESFHRWMSDLRKTIETRDIVYHYDTLRLPDKTIYYRTKMVPEFEQGNVSGVLVITKIINELQQTVDELEKRNFELDQFVYKISHDIRAPLATVLGIVHLSKIENDVSHWEQYFKMIENSMLRLDHFVQSMIIYSKSNHPDLTQEDIDFCKVLDKSKQNLGITLDTQNVIITLSVKGDNGTFTSDPSRLQIIFENIISNAIKFRRQSLSNSFLNITVTKHLDHVSITFEDNGIGIQEHQIRQVFDMFCRPTEFSDGPGLGLYIVKQIVLSLKGSVSIESNYGDGTTLTILLPK